MADLQEALSQLVEQFSLDDVKEGLAAIEEAFVSNDEEADATEEAPPAKKGAPKSKAKVEEEHTCEYSVNKKGVGAVICGARARNELDGCWFCGTEKSGHYKSQINASKREVAPKAKAPTASKAAPTPLVQKVIKVEKLPLQKIGPYHIYAPNRMIVARGDQPYVTGILGKDGKTVLPITPSVKAFAEAHNLTVQPPKGGKAPVKSVQAKPPTTAKAVVAKAVVAKPVAAKAVVAKAAAPKPTAVAKPAVAKPTAKPTPAKPAPKPKVVQPEPEAETVEIDEEVEVLEEQDEPVDDGEVEAVEEDVEFDLGEADVEAEAEPEAEDGEAEADEEDAPDFDEEVDEGEAVDDVEVEEEGEAGGED